MKPLFRGRLPLIALLFSVACARSPATAGEPAAATASTAASTAGAASAVPDWPADAKSLTDDEWRERLTAMQYKVLRKQGTEMAFSGPYWDSKEHGHYRCAGCGQLLFSSDDKFKSGTGWPSYTRPVDTSAVSTETDSTFGMVRTEALCSNCGGHLGHVFNDGPPPTGERWCINGAALYFEPVAEQ